MSLTTWFQVSKEINNRGPLANKKPDPSPGIPDDPLEPEPPTPTQPPLPEPEPLPPPIREPETPMPVTDPKPPETVQFCYRSFLAA